MTLWMQADPTLDRDLLLQWFVNGRTGARVYGRTSGTLSDHIHLYALTGVDTGCNLDPASGVLKTDGGLLGDLLTLVGAAAAVALPGVGGAVAGAVLTAGAVLINAKGHLSAVVVYPALPGWTPTPLPT
jgi:hypothetical protein